MAVLSDTFFCHLSLELSDSLHIPSHCYDYTRDQNVPQNWMACHAHLFNVLVQLNTEREFCQKSLYMQCFILLSDFVMFIQIAPFVIHKWLPKNSLWDVMQQLKRCY